jgi:acetolactate synthase-1/3 small subunit
MTIAVEIESHGRRQLIKQMNKLINVLQATDLTDGPSVTREMVLMRVRVAQEVRTAVLKEAEIFGARVVDSTIDGFALEVTGDIEKLDELINVMRTYGEIDVTRSGALAVSLEAKKLRLSPPILRCEATVTEEKNGVL